MRIICEPCEEPFCQLGLRMRLPFCILKVLGDPLDDGEIRFVEAAETLEGAKRRIETLAASLPGEYFIYDEQTGARVSVNAHGDVTKRTLRRSLAESSR